MATSHPPWISPALREAVRQIAHDREIRPKAACGETTSPSNNEKQTTPSNQKSADPVRQNAQNLEGQTRYDLSTLISALATVLFALPASAATSYTQSFTFADGTTNLGDGSVIQSNDGTASVQGGQLRLTSSANGSTAAVFHIPALQNSSPGWSAVFNFTIIDAPGGNPPAGGCREAGSLT